MASSGMPAFGTAVHAEALSDITADASATLAEARGAVTAAKVVAADIAASGLDVGTEDEHRHDRARRSDRAARRSRHPAPHAAARRGRRDGDRDGGCRGPDRHAARASRCRRRAEGRGGRRAAQAQREAEAAAAAAAQAAAAAAAANTPEGAKATARQLLGEYGWGDGQFSCLESLWTKESGWNYQAYNSGSGATGIPQALPGSKMASAGTDWQSNATTQIRWGLGYIQSVYGTPCSAWGHSQATNWY